MRARIFAILTLAPPPLFSLGSVASAYPFGPPEGGIGDTPLNSEQACANGEDNFFAAVRNGAAENTLSRNPTCAVHNQHPPGNE